MTPTNCMMSGRVVCSANGSLAMSRRTSLPSQIITSALNGRRRTISARSFARLTALRTTNVPAPPTFTTSKSFNSFARALGRKVLCPPTLMPLRRTTNAIGVLVCGPTAAETRVVCASVSQRRPKGVRCNDQSEILSVRRPRSARESHPLHCHLCHRAVPTSATATRLKILANEIVMPGKVIAHIDAGQINGW
jgi:hypothetical protein